VHSQRNGGSSALPTSDMVLISLLQRMAGLVKRHRSAGGDHRWPVWAVRDMSARPGGGLCKARFLRIAAIQGKVQECRA
jgi:hypothetical protein